MCDAFGTFPFPWLHFIGLYSPHIMSPPSNLHFVSFHVFFICQMCPLPSCICSFYFSSICNFCLFSTCTLLSHFSCNCHVCLFQICIVHFHFFCIVSPFFSRCKHSRTCAIRQHNPSYFRRPPSRRPVSPPSTLSSLPSRSFPTELSPSYFSWFPLRPPCSRFHLAPFPRSSPQAISHGFPSVHPVDASISSFPTELSPSYFPRFPLRPPSRRFRIAPSRQV